MLKMKTFGLLTFLGLGVLVFSQIPIPKREVGFVYKNGSPSAPVHLDFYIDNICPDSKNAWPTVLKVADFYGPEKLQLTTHLFPLPYHRNGFFTAKGSHIFEQVTKRNLTYMWMETVFDNVDSLTNTADMDLSDAQIIDKLAMIADSIGVQASTFKSLILDPNIEEDTRVEWKYCCTRGVAATPTFMLNDVVVGATPDWTVQDWKNVIDPLLGIPVSQDVSTSSCSPGQKVCQYLPGKTECCKKGEFCIPNVGCRC